MMNCVFSPYCTEERCDLSCSINAQFSYLIDRNKLDLNDIFTPSNQSLFNKYNDIITNNSSNLTTLESTDVTNCKNILTYCAICKHWKGSRLNCTVYSLPFTQYIESIKNSWSNSSSDELEYMKLWAKNSKFLVIYNLDYIRLKDFECQSLLTLLQERNTSSKQTYVIINKLSNLYGDGMLFARLTEILKASRYK